MCLSSNIATHPATGMIFEILRQSDRKEGSKKENVTGTSLDKSINFPVKSAVSMWWEGKLLGKYGLKHTGEGR